MLVTTPLIDVESEAESVLGPSETDASTRDPETPVDRVVESEADPPTTVSNRPPVTDGDKPAVSEVGIPGSSAGITTSIKDPPKIADPSVVESCVDLVT